MPLVGFVMVTLATEPVFAKGRAQGSHVRRLKRANAAGLAEGKPQPGASVRLKQATSRRDGSAGPTGGGRSKRKSKLIAYHRGATGTAAGVVTPPRRPKATAFSRSGPSERALARLLRRMPSRGSSQSAVIGGGTANSTARLTLQASRAGTRFYVDNRLVGTGQVVRHDVDEGQHRVEAVAPSGARIQKWLTVASGDERQIHLVW